MKLKKKPNGYVYAILSDGKALSLKTKSMATAKELAKEAQLDKIEKNTRAGEVSRRAIEALITGHVLTDVINEWEGWASSVAMSPLSIRRNRQILTAWVSGLPDIRLADITEAHIGDFINAEGKSTAATRHRQLAAIRSLFNFASARGLVTGNVSKNARVDLRALPHAQREVKQVQPLNKSEVSEIFLGADTFWRAVTGISYATALRLGDVIGLEWDCLSVPHHIVVWTEKRDRRVCLPVNEEVTPGLAEALALVPYNTTPYLFPEQREILLDPPRRARFSVYFGRLCKKAGIKGKSFHGLRHARISEWSKAGFSLDQCAEFAGHKSTRTTEGYVHE